MTPDPKPTEEKTSRPWLDLNRNGIADWEEPWLWQAVWGLFGAFVRTFAGDKTVIRRSVDAVDAERSRLGL